jgi:RimJ/RimL family protein N-acetyltransferase
MEVTLSKEIFFSVGFQTSLAVPQATLHVNMLVHGLNDFDVTQYLARVAPLHLSEEIEWISNLPKRSATDQVFMVVAHHGKRRVPIGVMGLHKIDMLNRTATTGAAILKKEYWGKSHGSEAKMLLLKHAFDSLGLRKIKSSVLSSNPRSKRYNQRCGYSTEGVLKAEKLKNGVYVDEILMAVTREQWLPIWNRYQANKNGSIV